MVKRMAGVTIIALIFSILHLFMAGNAFAADEQGSVTLTIPAGEYEINDRGKFHSVTMEGFGRLPDVGKPRLPARIFSIAIPPGAEVTNVTFCNHGETTLPGTYSIAPVSLPRVIGEEKPELYQRDQAMYEANYQSVYSRNEAYPASMGEFVSSANYRRYNLAEVRVCPFSWYPQTGDLAFRPEIEVCVEYTIPEKTNQPIINDFMVRTEQRAKRHIVNYDQAQAWYPRAKMRAGLHDYVIITLDSLTAAVQPLVIWETSKGRTVKVVTTDWIDANYTGVDLGEKMRNFLREKYPSSEWGIEDLCLVGLYDDVPIRRVWQDLGYGKPESDFYYAELSKPDSQSWDIDGDQRWGESTDPVDMYNEINVGRIPWSDAQSVTNICQKSVAYENNTDPAFKKNMLLLGAFFWPDTDNAEIMEYKSDPANYPWMADWTFTKLYEEAMTIYPCDLNLTWSNARDTWKDGRYAFVNYAGHGSPTTCSIYSPSQPFLSNATCPYLNPDYPSIVFADACSNADTDHLNIGQLLLKTGAVGFLGATKVACGASAWNEPLDGSSQALDVYFTSNVTSGNYTMGQAHQDALRKMYEYGLWYFPKYETYEWASIWGQPALSMGTMPALVMGLHTDVDGLIKPPGAETAMEIEIRDALQSFVPGTAQMHYRMGIDETYTSVTLTPLGGDLYEGVLPAVLPGDAPEFYFTAEGDGGGLVNLPASAPYNVYTFEVCMLETVACDDFENDTGWIVENNNVTAGGWERGDPQATPAQPEDDYSANGSNCYVTGAAGGAISDNDLDGGPSRLFSPKYQLDGNDAIVSFYAYFYHTSQGAQFPMRIQLGTSDITWYLVDELQHNPNWVHCSYRVSDHMTPPDTLQLRITVKDKPDDDIVEALIDDFSVMVLNDDPSLWASQYAISAASGAIVDFSLDAGATYANRPYLLLGSLSGTLEGYALPGGTTLPLNWDAFTDFMLGLLDSPVCTDFFSTLDSAGNANATLNTFGGLDPVLVGETAYFAYTLGQPFDFVSNPIEIDLDP